MTYGSMRSITNCEHDIFNIVDAHGGKKMRVEAHESKEPQPKPSWS